MRSLLHTSLFLATILDCSAAGGAYPPSLVIRGIQWAPTNTIIRLANGSDNAYGDGNGFEPQLKEKLSLGLAKVLGAPPQIRGINLRSPSAEAKGDGKKGRKASGILMVDGVLYMLVRNVSNSQLGWSEDHGQTWTWADWKFTNSFGCPSFLNFGRNYSGARDEFVYIYSPDSDNAYERADRMVLARVPKKKIRQREAYEFFVSVDEQNQPLWTKDIRGRGAVFTHAGNCYRSGITFHPTLKRYVWCQTGLGADPRFMGGLAIYDAPEPWGPWTTVYFTSEWDVGPGETSSIPNKWISGDGKSFYLVFSSNDSFSLRKGTFELTTDR